MVTPDNVIFQELLLNSTPPMCFPWARRHSSPSPIAPPGHPDSGVLTEPTLQSAAAFGPAAGLEKYDSDPVSVRQSKARPISSTVPGHRTFDPSPLPPPTRCGDLIPHKFAVTLHPGVDFTTHRMKVVALMERCAAYDSIEGAYVGMDNCLGVPTPGRYWCRLGPVAAIALSLDEDVQSICNGSLSELD